MANEFGINYGIRAGTNTSVPSRVADGREIMASMKKMNDAVVLTNGANNALTTSDIRLGFLPFGAKVYGGKCHTNAALTASTAVDVGIVGLSGVTYDNSPAALANNINLVATTVFAMPSDIASANVLPYTVTDPKGAYVKVSVLVNSTKTTATQLNVEVDFAAP